MLPPRISTSQAMFHFSPLDHPRQFFDASARLRHPLRFAMAERISNPHFLLPPGGGVIFDMDGLMLDTESISKMAWQQVARDDNFEIEDALFLRMIGRRGRDCAALMHEKFGLDFDFEAFHRKCGAWEDDHISRHGIALKAGAQELVRRLFEQGVPLAVATSTRLAKANSRLKQAGLRDYFSVVVGGDEIINGKPAPDIYLEAIRRLGIEPAKSFALEDSFAGVRSARAAGLQVIMVPDMLQPTDEIRALTVLVGRSLAEIRIDLPRSLPK